MPEATAPNPSMYATWPGRLVGWVVDWLILALTFGLATIVVALVVAVARPSHSVSGHLDGWEVLLVYGVPWVIWEVAWVGGPAMAKPGQRIAGFRVERVGGGRVTPVQALARAGVKALNIPLRGLFLLASAATIAGSPRRQAVHDLLTGTVCVPRGVAPTTPLAAATSVSAAPPTTTIEDTGVRGPFL